MKHSSALITLGLLVAGTAQAAPFTGKGLPADSVAFVHLDGDAAANSELTQAIRSMAKESKAKKGKNDKVAELLAECGIDPEKITDVSFGLAATSGKPGLSGIAHGAFDASKFNGIKSRHPEVRTKSAGGLTWYNTNDFDGADRKSKSSEKPEDTFYVALADATTLVFATEPRIDKTAAAATGKAASFAAPAAAKSLLSGTPSIVGWFPESAVTLFKQGKPDEGPTLKALSFTFGETAGNVALNADAVMNDEESAQQANMMATMYQGFAAQGLSKKTADAKQNADNAFYASVLKALKVSANASTLNVAFTYPSAKLAAKLQEKRAEILEAAEAAAK